MLAVSYTKEPEFAKGYAAARDLRAWLGRGGGWVVLDTDEIGEHARPVTVAEEAGIGAFYASYAPALELVGTHLQACTKCGGSGLSWVEGEFGEEAESFPCGVCDGLGYSVEVENGIAF
jgi:hypothetical protein